MKFLVNVLTTLVGFLAAAIILLTVDKYNPPKIPDVTNGMFVCMTQGKTHLAWRTPDGAMLSVDTWKLLNPVVNKYVIYKQSMLESCAILPIKDDDGKEQNEEKPTTAKK